MALLAAALGILGIGAGATFFWAQYHLHAAERALKRYSLDEAQYHLDLCLKVRSGSPAVHLLAAQTARRRDAYAEAEQHLAACTQRQGTTAAIELERSLLAAQQGELDGVEGLLRTHTRTDKPEAVLVLEAMAKGYLTRFWYDRALACLDMLLARQPRHPQALLIRARVREHQAREGQKGLEEDILRDYQNAVELRPSFEARLGLAGALDRAGQPWEAASEYERLRTEQASNAELLLGLARCRYRLGEVDQARRLLDELLQQNPESPHSVLSRTESERSLRGLALLERGLLEFHAGNLAEAETRLREAASLAQRTDCEALRVLGRCLQAAGKAEDARQCLGQIDATEKELLDVERLTIQANHSTHDVALLYEIAARWMQLGRDKDGVAALFVVLEEEPGHRPSHQALADYFERTEQPDRALRHRRASSPAEGAGASAR